MQADAGGWEQLTKGGGGAGAGSSTRRRTPARTSSCRTCGPWQPLTPGCRGATAPLCCLPPPTAPPPPPTRSGPPLSSYLHFEFPGRPGTAADVGELAQPGFWLSTRSTTRVWLGIVVPGEGGCLRHRTLLRGLLAVPRHKCLRAGASWKVT